PIPDLRLDDDGMSCTLSFSRAGFFCVVPWSTVFAMVGEDGRGMVWPDDVPAEVARQTQVRVVDGPPGKEAAKPTPVRAAKTAPKAKRPRKRPALVAVPDGETPVPAKPDKPGRDELATETAKSVERALPERASRKKKELPPYLRVVK